MGNLHYCGQNRRYTREYQRDMKNKISRNSTADLWKCVASLIILIHHSYQTGIEQGSYPFSTGYLFVEFFFLLTGFYTATHFDNGDSNKRNTCENAFRYTIHKYALYLAYTIPAIIMQYGLELFSLYVTRGFHISDTIDILQDLPFELSFLIMLYKMPHVATLWYLSAMFVVFPLFCILIQKINRYLLLSLGCIPVLLQYSGKFNSLHTVIMAPMWKALSSLLLGAMIYEILKETTNVNIKNFNKYWLSAVEACCFIIPVLFVFKNKGWHLLMIFFFSLGIGLMFSGKTISASFHSKIVGQLSKMSLSVYIWQWPVATLISKFAEGCAPGIKIALYINISLLWGGFWYYVVERRKKRKECFDR